MARRLGNAADEARHPRVGAELLASLTTAKLLIRMGTAFIGAESCRPLPEQTFSSPKDHVLGSYLHHP